MPGLFNPELIARYDRPAPRYTSYPPATRFREDFGADDYIDRARRTNEEPLPRPLSLYFHLPFCDTVCFYCACNKVVTGDHARSKPYVERLCREIALQGRLFDADRVVEQLHWGGGTPNFLRHDEMRALMAHTRRHFTLRDDDRGEYSIEIDPRSAGADTLGVLREIGFNRVSLGVQDLHPAVQQAVNRIQSGEQTRRVLEAARAQGFRSVNIDLMYGLPHQTVERFAATLDRVLDMAPDRLSVFSYAHLPERFGPQRRIDAAALPTPERKLDILRLTIERLDAAGYVHIGMDHFARRDDELARACEQGALHRNFQGYSTHAECDLVAMGVSAISHVGDMYAQEVRGIGEYFSRIDAGRIPVWRGYVLSREDRLRADVISGLLCGGRVSVQDIERRHGIDFRRHFAGELRALEQMAADGLVALTPAEIRVRPAGRLLVRNLCMVFDRSGAQTGTDDRFSSTV